MSPERTLEAISYVDETQFRQEMEGIKRCWNLLGPVSLLDKPGSTYATSFLGTPIFVRRGNDGITRCFRNCCPHRGGPLAWPGPSVCRVLRCKYHSWTFRDDGGLLSITGFQDQLETDSLSLGELPLSESGGLLYVANAGPPEPPVTPLKVQSRLGGRVAHLVGSRSYSAHCNWKIYVENWLESYHIQSLHGTLSAGIDLASYEVVSDRGWIYHSAQSRVLNKGRYAGFWAFNLPSSAINFFESGFSIEVVHPTTARETEIEYSFYSYDDDMSAAEAFMRSTDVVTVEDIRACEHVYQNVLCGSFSQGYLSKKREPSVTELYRFMSLFSAQ